MNISRSEQFRIVVLLNQMIITITWLCHCYLCGQRSVGITRHRQHQCATAMHIAYHRVVRRSHHVYRVLDKKYYYQMVVLLFADSACIPRYRQHHCATARQIAYRRVVRRSYQVYRVLDIKNRPLETTKHLLATYLFFLSNTMLSLSWINKLASHPHLTRK